MNTIESKIDILFKKVNSAMDNCYYTQSYLLLQQVHQQLLLIHRNNLLWVYYYLNLASVYNNMGRFLDCLDCCVNAEHISSLKRNDDLIAKIKSIKSTAYLNIGEDYQASIKNIKEAIRIYKILNQKENEALSLITYGDIILRQGELVQAIQNYSKALLIAKRIKDKRLEGKSLMVLGSVFMGRRFLYLAIDHFREAEMLFKKINNNQGVVMALYERANAYISLKRVEETLDLIKQIEVLISIDSVMRSFLFNLKYCIHNLNKEFKEAMDCANLLLNFFIKSQDKKGEAESLLKIAGVYYNISNMVDAKNYGEMALNIAEHIGDKLIQQKCNETLRYIDYVDKNNINLEDIRKYEEDDTKRN